mmetsp:Transcript_18035/g.49774  ORF Transcript_18035/g.49774 Transcript_18035/m.49774 type:complete len:271 (+) Transcript_18035:172-984(+)
MRCSSSAWSARASSTSACSESRMRRCFSSRCLSSSHNRALASSASACSASSERRRLSSPARSSSSSSALAISASASSSSRRLRRAAKAASSNPAWRTSMLCKRLAMRSERWSLSRSRACIIWRRFAAASWLLPAPEPRALLSRPLATLPSLAWPAFSLPDLYSPSPIVAYLAVACRFLSTFTLVRYRLSAETSPSVLVCKCHPWLAFESSMCLSCHCDAEDAGGAGMAPLAKAPEGGRAGVGGHTPRLGRTMALWLASGASLRKGVAGGA